MAAADVAYEHNWNSLVGCLQALLRQAGVPAAAATVSAVSGEAFRIEPVFGRIGYVPHPLEGLGQDLAALGLRARVDVWEIGGRRGPLSAIRAGRRIRGAVAKGRAVAAYGTAHAEFGLIVDYDTERRSYVVRGALTDEVGGLMPGGRFLAWDADWLALVIPRGRESIGRASPAFLAARAAAHALAAEAAMGLRRWIAVLEDGTEIDACAHAARAQALAAARGEAARFWRDIAESGAAAAAATVEPARRQALIYSRFATLFPFPAGGDVTGGGRMVGAGTLRDALAVEEELAESLAVVSQAGA